MNQHHHWERLIAHRHLELIARADRARLVRQVLEASRAHRSHARPALRKRLGDLLIRWGTRLQATSRPRAS